MFSPGKSWLSTATQSSQSLLAYRLIVISVKVPARQIGFSIRSEPSENESCDWWNEWIKFEWPNKKNLLKFAQVQKNWIFLGSEFILYENMNSLRIIGFQRSYIESRPLHELMKSLLTSFLFIQDELISFPYWRISQLIHSFIHLLLII